MGPISTILLAAKPTQKQLNEIDKIIQHISSIRENENFWVTSTKYINGSAEADGQPFALSINKIDKDNYEDASLANISSRIGYLPVYDIAIIAMCNQSIDHRILGELTYYFTNMFEAYIDFGGALLPTLKHLPWYMRSGTHSWQDIEPYYQKMKSKIEGKLHVITYKVDSNRTWAYQIGDVEFMKNWLTHPDFHMVK